MSERPILFSASMVRAILDGRKTQTRRVVTDFTSQGNWKASELDLSRAWVDPGPSPAGNRGPYLKSYVRFAPLRARGWEDEPDTIVDRLYPRWFPEDRLWVRETFTESRDKACVLYRADPVFDSTNVFDWRWSSSIHMPRRVSRITLEVTGIRVERVQEITAADCIAEGASAHLAFQQIWQAVNAKRGYGWDVNPWVWVIEFKRLESASVAA